MIRRTTLVSLALSTASIVGLLAAPPAQLTVSVPFRVLMEDGTSVTDLAPEEVTLLVDGRARAITKLELVSAPPADTGRTDTASSAPRPFITNEVDPREATSRVYYLVMHNPVPIDALEVTLDRLLPGLASTDRVGLAHLLHPDASLQPTTRHADVRAAALRAALLPSHGCATQSSLGALAALMRALPSDPRVVVVLLSNGFGAPAGSATTQIGSASELCPVQSVHYEQLGPAARAFAGDFFIRYITAATTVSSGRFAGGLNLILTNLRAHAPRQAFENVAGAPVIFYRAQVELSPDEAQTDAPAVRIEVKRPGVEVRAPTVLAGLPTATSTAPTVRDLLQSSGSTSDLALRAINVTAPNPDDGRVRFVSVFEPIARDVALSSARAGLFDEAGLQWSQWTAAPEELQQQPLRFALVAPPGSYRVRIVAIDGDGRAGAIEETVRGLRAPTGEISASGLLLGVANDGNFAPRLLFTAEPSVIGYCEIYGTTTEQTVDVTLELRSSDGQRSLATAETTVSEPTNAGARVAYGGFDIAAAAPGDYPIRATVRVDGRVVATLERTLRKAR